MTAAETLAEIPPWTKLPCDECGDIHDATRTEGRKRKDVELCDGCIMFARGVKAGGEQAQTRIRELEAELATLRGYQCAYAQGAHGHAGCGRCVECQRLQLARLEVELAQIDEALARRPALAHCKTRREAVDLACAAASRAERLERERDDALVRAMHRACTSQEHDPGAGMFHGCCVLCAVPWPCELARADLGKAERAEARGDG